MKELKRKENNSTLVLANKIGPPHTIHSQGMILQKQTDFNNQTETVAH